MSEVRTEEEQIEAFKNWWKKNGTSLIMAVSVSVAGYFGWQAWTQSQANHASEASALYQNMSDAAADLTKEANRKTVTFIANQLVADYDDTGYATFGQLFAAKVAVEEGDFDGAIAALNAAKATTQDASFIAIADLRLARLLFEKNELDAALKQIDAIQSVEFNVQKHELKGDILLKQGDKEAARVAYQAATDALTGKTSHPLLEIKLQDLVKS